MIRSWSQLLVIEMHSLTAKEGFGMMNRGDVIVLFIINVLWCPGNAYLTERAHGQKTKTVTEESFWNGLQKNYWQLCWHIIVFVIN